MLTPPGYKVLRKRTLGGTKHLKSVHYDVHYVVAKIVADILDPLEMNVDEFILWLEENVSFVCEAQAGNTCLGTDAEIAEDLLVEVEQVDRWANNEP